MATASTSTAARLFNLGVTLCEQQQYRASALTFAAAARAPGFDQPGKAHALYEAASQLFATMRMHNDRTQLVDDVRRAFDYLSRCLLNIRQHPSAFDMTMQIHSLRERIYTYTGDHAASYKVIAKSLDLTNEAASNSQSNEHHAHIMRWWIYFRGRAVSNVLASGKSIDEAVELAVVSARLCAQANDRLSAAAFYLAQAQIAIAAPQTGPGRPAPQLDLARECFPDPATGEGKEELEHILLQCCAAILECLHKLRTCQFESVKNEVLPNLSHFYNGLRSARKRNLYGQWRWVPYHIMSAIVYYIMTNVTRMVHDPERTLVHAMTALSRIGIVQDKLPAINDSVVENQGVPPRAARALAVALLENAARLRLTELGLSSAAVLLAAAVKLMFPSTELQRRIANTESGNAPEGEMLKVLLSGIDEVGVVPRCTTFLLLGEYHGLRGKVFGARIATDFLHALRQMPQHKFNGLEPGWFSDTWHMAVSYLSLLTGERRSDLASLAVAKAGREDNPEFANTFVSRHVFAFAWFSMGVFNMRATEVLESRRALNRCLQLVAPLSVGREQVEANANSVLSGLSVTHERITEEAAKAIDQSVTLADAINDPVTLIRAAKQARKLHSRVNQGERRKSELDTVVANATETLNSRQKGMVPIIAGLLGTPS